MPSSLPPSQPIHRAPTLYLAGRDARQEKLTLRCHLLLQCAERLIINAGIDRVVIRRTKEDYSVVHVGGLDPKTILFQLCKVTDRRRAPDRNRCAPFMRQLYALALLHRASLGSARLRDDGP